MARAEHVQPPRPAGSPQERRRAAAGHACGGPALHQGSRAHGSIRKTADVPHVASSAINRQILKLVANLGVRLFDRMPDGMRPTPAGQVQLRHVRETMSNYDRLLAEIDELRGVRSGGPCV